MTLENHMVIGDYYRDESEVDDEAVLEMELMRLFDELPDRPDMSLVLEEVAPGWERDFRDIRIAWDYFYEFNAEEMDRLSRRLRCEEVFAAGLANSAEETRTLFRELSEIGSSLSSLWRQETTRKEYER